MKKTLHMEHDAGKFGTVVFAARRLSQDIAAMSWISRNYLGNFVAQPSQKYEALCQKKHGSSKFTCIIYSPDDAQQILYQLQCNLEQEQFHGTCSVFESNGDIKARLAVYGRITTKAILVWGISDSALILKPRDEQGEA